MKVVILGLALCGIAAATHPLLKRQDVPDCSDVDNGLFLEYATCLSDATSDVAGLCGCSSLYCRAVQGDDAQACRDIQCDLCNEDVSSDCLCGSTNPPDTDPPTDFPDCSDLDVSVALEYATCLSDATPDAAGLCGCSSLYCRAVQGDDAQACRDTQCDFCDFNNEDVSSDCLCGSTNPPDTDPPTDFPDCSDLDVSVALEYATCLSDATPDAAGLCGCSSLFCRAVQGDDAQACRDTKCDFCELFGEAISSDCMCNGTDPTDTDPTDTDPTDTDPTDADPTTDGALALVTFKGVLALVLLVAAFFVL